MKVLLTGGTGYIGSHTALVLHQAGHEVVLLDNLSNSQINVLDRLYEIAGHHFPLMQGDVRDEAFLNKVFSDHVFDAVIHFAGLKAVGESNIQPLLYYSNNVNGSLTLLSVMQRHDVHKFVFSSSATVYGDPVYLPYDELHRTHATNPYGRTKLQVEQLLNDLAESDPNWQIAALRYFNPVGAHQSGLIGENPNGIPNNLMPYIAQVATGKLKHLNIFGNDYPTPDGTGVRDYIHVTDLAEGHLAALNFLRQSHGFHTFNLGSGRGTSVLQMLEAFERVNGIKIPFEFAPKRKGDIAESYAKVDKSAAQLHWRTKKGLDEMCASHWKWQQHIG